MSVASEQDSNAEMGMATTNVMGRVAASIGDLHSVSPNFSPFLGIPNGGVLFALPALLAVGLLEYTDRFFCLPKGYYGIDSIFCFWDSWRWHESKILNH